MNTNEDTKAFFLQPAIAASVMMRRTSFSIWELLQISSQVPLTCICSASAISCRWLGTTKLITYDWSLRNDHKSVHMFSFFIISEREIKLWLQKTEDTGWNVAFKKVTTWIQKSVRNRFRGCWGRSLPVGIGTDVVNEWAVLQNGLHFPKRDVLACLQFHQVLLAVYKKRTRVTILTDATLESYTHIHLFTDLLPMILRHPSGWNSPMSPVQNHRWPFSSTKKSPRFVASFL